MDKHLIDILNGWEQNHILPFFWQHGEDASVLKEEMLKIHESNIGAVCVEARPHPDFAGPQWWRDMDIIMGEAKKYGMKVWLLDDSHFPTGFANGWIRDKYPEKAKRYIMEKHVDADGPINGSSFDIKTWLNKFDWMFPDEKLLMNDRLLAVIASKKTGHGDDIDNSLIDVTSYVYDGILYWNVPEGSWRVFIIIETGNWGGVPDYINIIDADSVRVQIDAVYETHYERYKEEFGNTFAGFFSDEPSIKNTKGFNFGESIGRKRMSLPWCNELEQLIETSFGGNYKRFLPCLWYNAGEGTSQARYKYMDLVSRLYAKNFVGQIGKWCKEHGVEYIGHVIEDANAHARLGHGAGHFFRAVSGQHMSGFDVIGQQVWPRYECFDYSGMDTELYDYEFYHFALAKLGVSLGHIDPIKQGRTMVELFGASGWVEGVKLMKWILDHVLVRGTNYLVPHAFNPKEFPDVDCPPHFYARGRNPQFRYFGHLMKYANRLCHLLSDGIHVAPAAVLYHAEAEWSGEYMYSQKPAHMLARSQIDYDIIPSDVFDCKEDFKASLNGNKLVVNGEEYGCLVVPYSLYIKKSVAEFIADAGEKGFSTLFINGLPEGIIDEEDSNKSKRLLGSLESCQVVSLEEMEQALRQKGLYEISLSTEAPYLRYYHYKRGKTDIFMFFNEHPFNEINTEVSIPVVGNVSRYDAFINKVTPAPFTFDGGFTKIPLKLSNYESNVFIFGEIHEKDLTAASFIESSLANNNRLNEVCIESKWKVSTATALQYPSFAYKMDITKLVNLSTPELFPYFSGTVRYETEFNLNQKIENAFIDLGDVYEVAELWINGKNAGIKLCPPYKIDVSGMLKEGVNELRIDVTNTLVKECKDWGSINAVMEPTGLIGPVKIKYHSASDERGRQN